MFFVQRKKIFWKIRTQFLFSFIIGVIVTLTVAITVSYTSINTVYMRINERNTDIENGQIAGEIEAFFSEIETLLANRIVNHSSVKQLVRYHEISVIDLNYAIQGIAREIIKVTRDCQYIDSVYMYVADEWFLAMSNTNTMRYFNPELSWPSSRVMEELAGAEFSMRLAGDIRDGDFPLEMPEPAYLMIYKKGNGINRSSTYCVNIKESTICEMYTGFMENSARTVRVLDSEGMVISSVYKEEIGSQFVLLDGKDITEGGMIEADGMMVSYMPVGKCGLVVASTIPAAVYTSELTMIRNKMLAVFVLGMIGISLFFTYWIGQKLKPLEEILLGMESAGRGDYSRQLQITGADELSEFTRNYNVMLTNLQEQTKNRRQAEAELRERELAVLRNEINPHFLYNTLNTIKCMADLKGNEEVAKCAVALGGIVAPLYKNNNPTWTLREEIQIVGKYLEIMNIRYCNGIQYTEHISNELLDRQIMRFILQPIIENSIIHGFFGRTYAGWIILAAEIQEDDLLITVEDDGIGMTDEELKQFNESLASGTAVEGVGMMNVSRRINLRYGMEYGVLLTHSAYGGLCTRIRLPKR